MTAQDVLKMAFDCGVLIQVKGDKLHLEAKEAPPNHLVAEIRHYKADLIALLDTNNPHTKGEIKPVLKVVAKSELPKDRADLIHQLETQVKSESHSQTVDGRLNLLVNPQIEDGRLNPKNGEKQSPKNLGDVLKTEQTTAPNIRDTFTQIEETSADGRKIPFNLDNYRHLVTCNQCEYLSFTGSCSRLGKRVNRSIKLIKTYLL